MAQLSSKEREAIIVQVALRRIDVARSKGRTNVNLSKDEMAALERRRKRMEKEAEKEKKKQKKKKKGSGNSSDRKKKKEERVAVPLSQLEPVSNKKKSSPRLPDSLASSRQPSSVDLTKASEGQNYPPIGYFPPPSGPSSRPRSSTNRSQRPPSRLREDRPDSPYRMDYVQRPDSSHRYASDGIPRGMHPDAAWQYGHDYSPPSPAGSRDGHDPFQYQIAGPRAPYPHSASGAAAASRRHASGPADSYAIRRGAAPAAARGRRYEMSSGTDSQTSDDDDTSDELGHGAQIREPPGRDRGRNQIVVEESPEREPPPPPPPSKKKSGSPVKRKPVASSNGRRKKK